MGADFSGYASKAGLKCSDGRTITPEAFKHMDGKTVPLVWQHGHNDPNNVMGHVLLEARNDGLYGYGFFNGTPSGIAGKQLVEHKDVVALSVYANQLVEKSKQVLHGIVREVSLVLSGANPGALIDNIKIAHSADDIETLEDEAIIHTGESLEDEEPPVDKPTEGEEKPAEGEKPEGEKPEGEKPAEGEGSVEHAATDSLATIYNEMTDEQKNVVNLMVGAALEGADNAQHSDNGTEGDLTHKEGTDTMSRNVFDQTDASKKGAEVALSHSDILGIVQDAKSRGSLRQAVQSYALAHGIEDIDTLFPDAKAIASTPEFDKRRTEWVASVLNGTRHSPFSRIKSLSADLTHDEARAKGYIKGTLKKEEFFGILSRVTTPKTIYKKQKLDRDDMLDITDFDVVVWLKGEMRLMLEEEIAGAILFGDGREVDDEDKISETNIRPVSKDEDLYAATVYLNLGDASSSYNEVSDAVLLHRHLYKGSGTPTFYTTETVITGMLMLRDTLGRKIYRNTDELAADLRVAAIVPCEAMEDRDPDLIGIIVNLQDYTVGSDAGGDVTMFDDFDIDYNQYKYLIETRLSGALTKIRSAIVLRKTGSGAALVTPAAPTQAGANVTVVNTTGAVYKVAAFDLTPTYNGSPVTVGQTVTASFPIVLDDGGSVTIEATPASSSYYLDNNVEDTFRYDYDA